MDIKTACEWLRKDTSIQKIREAELKGLSRQDIINQIDKAIEVVCSAAEQKDHS